MKTRNIIHIHLKEENRDLYYSSMTTFFDNIEKNKVGVVAQTVKNYMSVNKTNVFENDKIRIEKDIPLYLDSKPKKTPAKNMLTGNQLNAVSKFLS